MEINEKDFERLKAALGQAYRQEHRKMWEELTAKGRASADEIYNALMDQARQVAGQYPEFDIVQEAQNPEFMAMLTAGLAMSRAYEAVHHDQLVEAALAFGLAQGNPDRPQENGLAGVASAATPGSMANSTRAQRDQIRSRVSRGETVRL